MYIQGTQPIGERALAGSVDVFANVEHNPIITYMLAYG
jgi:hypothetical protein